MSHRSKEYEAIIKKAEADLRQLVGIPENYKVIFMQGGGSLQFACVCMNLLRGKFLYDFIELKKKKIVLLEILNLLPHFLFISLFFSINLFL
jgi:phosphoserine aminotransferase